MPFDFKAYKAKCDALTTEELQIEWQNYTRQLTTGATVTATSVLFSPLTSGISLIGLGISLPQLHNARKKRAIVGNQMLLQGSEPLTRRRDIIIPAASSVAFAALTYGLTPGVAEAIGGEAGARGVEYVISHATLDALWAVLDETRNVCQHKREQRKLRRQQKQMKEAEISYHYAESNEKLLEGSSNGPPNDGKCRLRKSKCTCKFRNQSRSGRKSSSTKQLGQKEKKSKDEEALAPSPHKNRPVRSVSQQRVPNKPNLKHNSKSFALYHRSFSFENSLQPVLSSAGLKSSKPLITQPTSPIKRLAEKPYLTATLGEEAIIDNSSSSGEESDEEDDEDEDDETDDEKDPNVVEHVLTLEEEVALLKATILRMEMEKRGLIVEDNPNLGPTRVNDLKVKGDTTVRPPTLAKNDIDTNATKVVSSVKNSSTYMLQEQGSQDILARPPMSVFTQAKNSFSRRRSSFTSQAKKMEEALCSKSLTNQKLSAHDASSAEKSQQTTDYSQPSYRKDRVRPLRKRHDSGYFSSYQLSSSVASTPGIILYDEEQATKSTPKNKSNNILNNSRSPTAKKDRLRPGSVATDTLGPNPIPRATSPSPPHIDRGRYVNSFQKLQLASSTAPNSVGNMTMNLRKEQIRMRSSIPKFTPEAVLQMNNDSGEEDEIWNLPAQRASYVRLPQYSQDPPIARSWRAPD